MTDTWDTIADWYADHVGRGSAMHRFARDLLVDVLPDLGAALDAISRSLVPGGRLVFTVPHPCFEAPHARWVGTERVIGGYGDEGFWRSTSPQGVRRAGNHHRTIARYLTALIDHGFRLTMIAEPPADARVVAEQPHRAALPPFLLVGASSGRPRVI